MIYSQIQRNMMWCLGGLSAYKPTVSLSNEFIMYSSFKVFRNNDLRKNGS